MSASASRLSSVAPCGLLPDFTTHSQEVHFQFAKRTAWDHRFQVSEVARGKAVFVVESLHNMDKGMEKLTAIKSAVGEHELTLLDIRRQPSSWVWEITTPIAPVWDGQHVKGMACSVKKQQSFRGTKFRIDIKSRGAIGVNATTRWRLQGDKVRLAILFPLRRTSAKILFLSLVVVLRSALRMVLRSPTLNDLPATRASASTTHMPML